MRQEISTIAKQELDSALSHGSTAKKPWHRSWHVPSKTDTSTASSSIPSSSKPARTPSMSNAAAIRKSGKS